jgi:hypothetical protein
MRWLGKLNGKSLACHDYETPPALGNAIIGNLQDIPIGDVPQRRQTAEELV